MLRSFALLRPNAALAVILPFAVLFAGACGNTGTTSTGDAGMGDLAKASTDGPLASPDMALAPIDMIGLLPVDMRNPAGIGPAPVQIGSTTDLTAAGSYVLLAKTGITNATGSMITGGNLGLSPAAATLITGFALVADASKVFSTSFAVVAPGKVYASNYAVPTPANLTAAILSMQAAYNDAAGRKNPDFLNMGAGNIGGKTLAPGLYSWGTGVTIPTDVTIAGGANDTWIFQISNDLELSSAKNVILSGGAQAKNIVWQVAGIVTIHTNAHFEGVILGKTSITLQTTATMHGRALAQTLVAIDNNAITAP